ncbi:MAG TPA: hypothetical protein VL307_18225 [Chitinophagaceae bacterium]|nr:hypothetical protein [Chitinophagaceae bacterium]
MQKIVVSLSLLAIIVSVLTIACTDSSANNNKTTVAKDSAARVQRGSYLVNAIGCDDCHSPKRMGAHGPEIIPELRFSGFPQNAALPPVDKSEIQKGWTLFAPGLTSAVGPWGASFAANITSDGSGIGNWKEENFMRAMREGKYKGLATGRPLLPPMPWTVYRNLSDEDLLSIFAYLKTTRPVKNVAPAPKSLQEIQ